MQLYQFILIEHEPENKRATTSQPTVWSLPFKIIVNVTNKTVYLVLICILLSTEESNIFSCFSYLLLDFWELCIESFYPFLYQKISIFVLSGASPFHKTSYC